MQHTYGQWESASKMTMFVLYCIALYAINIIQLLRKTTFKLMKDLNVTSISKTKPTLSFSY